MYLLSLYFDEKTDRHIRSFIKQVAKKTGNTYMTDGNVPPHITIAAIETQNVEPLICELEQIIPEFQQGKLTWASVASFLPSVLYIAPVLNKYLHEMSVQIYERIKEIEGLKLRPTYVPFHWMPHTTIAKKLSKEELKSAFEELQNSFGMFEGEVIKIGLAKTSPYEDIKVWDLKKGEL